MIDVYCEKIYIFGLGIYKSFVQKLGQNFLVFGQFLSNNKHQIKRLRLFWTV